MRLLWIDADGKPCFTDFPDDRVPSYAILSHTWRTDGGEVTYKDVLDGIATSRLGYEKIQFCREQVPRHGLRYFWADTCCIDKSSSAELQESINLMYRWYRRA